MGNNFKSFCLSLISTLIIVLSAYVTFIPEQNIFFLNGLYILLGSICAILFYDFVEYGRFTPPEKVQNIFESLRAFGEKGWKSVAIVAFLFVGAKLIIQNFTGISVESDLVHYDAKMFLEGLTPYKDFISREPYLLFLSSFFLKIFGSISLDLYLNFYLIFSIITLGILFKIGEKIQDKKLGFIFVVLFALSPFLIKYPSANYQFYGSIYLCFISGSIYYLFEGLKHKTGGNFFLVGLLIGITVWIYRGSIPFIVIISFLSTFLLAKNISFKRNLFLNTMVFLGLSISILPPVAYYSQVLGFTWFNIILSSKFLLIIYALYFPVFFLSYVYKKWIIQSAVWQNILFFAFLTIVAYMFFFTVADNTTVKEKIATFHDYFRHLGYILFPSMLFGSVVFIEYIFPKILGKKSWIFIINMVLLGLIFYGTTHMLRGTSFELSIHHSAIFIGCFIWYTFTHFQLLKKISIDHIVFPEHIFILTMFIIIYLCGNLFYVDWIETYAINFVIPSILITGLLARTLIKESSWYGKYVVSLALFGVFTIFYYFNYNIVESSDLKKSSVLSIVSYLKENTSQNDIIFTANPTFAFRSDRPLALNLSHPLVYIKNPPYFHDYDPYGLVPPILKVIEYLDKNQVPYIVADSRTKALFISTRHQYIQDYILTHYMLENTIDGVEIYKRK